MTEYEWAVFHADWSDDDPQYVGLTEEQARTFVDGRRTGGWAVARRPRVVVPPWERVS